MKKIYIVLLAVLLAAVSCVKDIPVQTISIDPSSKTLVEGETCELHIMLSPHDATNLNVFWKSDNSDVASVTQEGVVTALRTGSARITVSSQDCPASATCTIMVTPKHVPSTRLVLNHVSCELVAGQSDTLSCLVMPSDATYQEVVWTSDDASVVFVDGGIVNAIAPGQATVTASNGELTVSCRYVVTIPPAGIELSSSDLELYEMDSHKLVANVTPENATDKTLTWESCNEAVATVSENGLVTAVTAGVTDIICRNSYGQSKYCRVTVKCHVESVSLSSESVNLNLYDRHFDLTATVYPDRATDKSLIWQSSDPKVATVNGEGCVTLHAPGAAVITVTSSDRGKSAACNVVVNDSEISIDSEEYAVKKGETGKITITSNTEYTITNSHPEVAEVALDGTVTAKETGETVVCATTKAGGKHATCVIKVTPRAAGVVLVPTADQLLFVGESKSFEANSKPAGVVDVFEWTVSDPEVAAIVPNGTKCTLTALKNGKVTLTVSIEGGEFTKSCDVEVRTHVQSISLDRTSLQMKKGETVSLAADVKPSEAYDKSINWKSSNPSVASVDSKGNVKALASGSATISAVTVDTDSSGEHLTASCDVTVTVPVTGVSLNYSEKVVAPGKTLDLVATVVPSDASVKGVQWTSSDPAIASVSASGVVSALKEGKATITATTASGNFSAKCEITVAVPVSGVTLNMASKELTLGVEDTFTLIATVMPADALHKEISWKSSNPSVADVDDSGKVTAHAEGRTTITVTTVEGGFNKSCEVSVVKQSIPVTGISLSQTGTVNLRPGAELAITAVVSPSDATDTTVVWSTSDPSVATVTEGVVKAVAEGSATITASSADGKIKSSVRVMVSTNHVTGVSLNTAGPVMLSIGGTYKLSATVTPADADDKSCRWSSSNTAVVSVDAQGNVKALSEGTTRVTVTTVDGGYTASCEFEVVEKVIYPTKVRLNQTTANIFVGDTLRIQAIVEPSDYNVPLKWEVGTVGSVVSVDQNGLVTARKAGDANVLCRYYYADGKTNTVKCGITVRDVFVTGVSLDRHQLAVKEGDRAILTATLSPVNATNKNVTWTSSDTSVAEVSNGVIIAKKKGTAVITVRTNDGGKTDSCEVTVKSASAEPGSSEPIVFEEWN